MGTEVLRPQDCLVRPSAKAWRGPKRSPQPAAKPARQMPQQALQDPAATPLEVRLRVAVRGGCDAYAGSVCAMSPSPRALPLPSFSRKAAAAAVAAAIDDSATQGLRRLLGLE